MILHAQTCSFVVNTKSGLFLTSIPLGTYSSSLSTLGNITASDNISSSGNIFGNSIIADEIQIQGQASGFQFGGPSNDVERIYWDGSAMNLMVADSDVLQVRSTGIKVENHITASDNISAGGTITATSYNGSLSNMTGTIDGGTF